MYKFPQHLFCDVRIETVYKSNIRNELGRIEEAREKSDRGAFIRIFDGKRWYYSSTSSLNDIQQEIDALAALADPAAVAHNLKLTNKLERSNGEYFSFTKRSVINVKISDKIELTKSYASLVADDSQIKHWSVTYSDWHIVKHIISSTGTDVKFDNQMCGLRIDFRFGSGSEVFSESWSKAKQFYPELESLHPEAKSHLEKARDFYQKAERIEGGKYTVVLSPMAAGIFAHESFGHKSEADFMIGDETMKREWNIGRKVGADILSIVDEGLIPGSGFVPFDDEGNRGKKTHLIKAGILKGRLHSSTTASELDEDPTGNARAINFEYEPIVRMTTTYIEPGDQTKENLIAGIDHGILIDTVKHGSGMSTFTLAPSIAYLIEDGKVTRPVKFSVITGNVLTTLNQIDALSDRLEIFSFVGGGCGKMEQFPLPVSFGGPYVRVRDMSVQ